MANVAEGFERDGNREFLQFLHTLKVHAVKSAPISTWRSDQQYLATETVDEILQAVIRLSRMISNLMKHLRASPMRGRKLSDRTTDNPS